MNPLTKEGNIMKKIIAICASLLLIAGAFSACSKTTPATPTDAETTTVVATADDAVEVASPADAN